MEKINDGFEIADEDLSLRGPGEFFGSKQSGFFQYKIANMVTDTSIIKNARKAAMILIKNDSNLTSENNQKLKNCLINDYSQYLGSIKLSS